MEMENSSLASELARVQTMVRELEANMDHRADLPPVAREICGELACRVDRSLRMARSWSADAAGDTGNNNAAAHFKRRKGVPSVRRQVRVTSVTDTSAAAALDDGFSWRKYGQKDILGAKYPRSYFRCTHRHTQNCLATKQVQRADDDPLLFDVVYHGAHTCVQQQANKPEHQLHDGQVQDQTSLLLLPVEETETGGGGGGGGLPLHQGGFREPVTSYYPPLSPTTLEWQIRSSHASFGAAGGVELEHHFQEFFSNPPDDAFQWDFQDLYA